MEPDDVGGDEKVSIDLSKAGLGGFQRSKSKFVEGLWMLAEWLAVYNPLQVSSGVRRMVLRGFGARVGRGVVLRPRLRVKFPWNLEIGDRSWIGEGVWCHNQEKITIGCDVVISQEAFLTTGSHDTRTTMDLIVKPIRIEDGAWITSRAIVLQGVTVGRNSILTPGSVAREDMLENGIYAGNPAMRVGTRDVFGEVGRT